MGVKMHTGRHSQHTQSGATLAVVMILVSAGMLLAVSALRSATTEAQLSGTLIAAQEAFWLAELGVASGIRFAHARPAELPDSSARELKTHISHRRGYTETVILQNGADNHCPPLAPANAIRRHYEIHATGMAARGAISTHVQGFYVCSEICSAIDCEVPEYPPVKSYWKAVAGGLPP